MVTVSPTLIFLRACQKISPHFPCSRRIWQSSRSNPRSYSLTGPKLLKLHERHGKLATVTAVRPSARFGSIMFNGDLMAEFEEKPQAGEGWINGGFFVLEPGIIDYLDDDECIWEHEPMRRLAQDNQMAVYRHDSFWQCMDTLRDVRLLEQLWQSGAAPWKLS
jgi:glucose-1-phosphate cytidylyltransferase